MASARLQVSLTMLPYQLRVADLRKDRLKECAWAILNIVVLSKRTHFFSFIETNDEISLILEEDAVALFPRDLLSLSPKIYRAFEATLIDGPGEQKSIVSALSHPLGYSGVSIMYLSTFRTDFVLIGEPDIPTALSILKNDFVISSDFAIVSQLEKWNAQNTQGGIPIQKQFKHEKHEPLMFEQEGDTPQQTQGCDSPCSKDTERNAFNLAVATEPLNLVSLLRDQIGTHSIRFIFDEDRSSKDFFSYHQMENEISMILSNQEKEILEEDNIEFSLYNDTFARITIDEGPLGFDQAGIVSSMANPLTAASINLFYISTFTTDHILVKTDEIERAQDVLDGALKK